MFTDGPAVHKGRAVAVRRAGASLVGASTAPDREAKTLDTPIAVVGHVPTAPRWRRTTVFGADEEMAGVRQPVGWTRR